MTHDAPTVHIAGLDLGQMSDPTALAVLRQTPGAKPDKPNYLIRTLHRFELGTPYPAIVGKVGAWVSSAPLSGGVLAIDQTGVGRPVVELFKQANLPVSIQPISITSGAGWTSTDDGYHVGKRELVATLQVLLGERRLIAADNLPEGKTLARELQTFSAKITTAGNETFEAWRERDHDDLVLAVALAAWIGEHTAACWGMDSIGSDLNDRGSGDFRDMPDGLNYDPSRGLDFPSW